MTRRRWIADEVSGNQAFLTGEHARHLAQVLRARVGQEFDISTGGEVRRGTIVRVGPERVEFELREAVTEASSAKVTVAISIFKFDRMEWAIEKCTELGVARIIPVLAGRTEKHLATSAAKRVGRWRRLVSQAAEQSRQVSAPEVDDPVKLGDVLRIEADTRIVLSEMERDLSLKDAIPVGSDPVVLAFGPEGGWKNDELTAFEKAGWISASLGSTILRVETAVIAAVAVCASVLNS
ncbi:MAG: 16S rRNA methyltransferase [Acidobacteria bacterium]|nr:MAG: 16S rRNA methyltransferase [Acidobacteriota bacterium]